MALSENLLATARRLGHALEPVPQRAEDRGPEDDWDGLFPVESFSFEGATDWVNAAPLSGEDLRGRVVLVHFWSYASINSLRSLPWVRGWMSAYAGRLAVVGVHSPEFAFEHRRRRPPGGARPRHLLAGRHRSGLRGVARQRDTVDHSTVEIEFFDPGVALYAVTFG